MKTTNPVRLLSASSLVVLLAACAQVGGGNQPAQQQQQAAAPAAPAAKPAPTKPTGTPAGMNDKGEVVESRQISAGSGKQVKGRGGWEGEIVGKPAPNSKFTKLEIGMSMKEVTDLVGQPTDSGAYVTGKAWIPFYFGSDRHRYEFVYKNQGRLIFAGGSLGNFTGGNLIWIIHNRNEPAYR